jgi:hypothetical protein
MAKPVRDTRWFVLASESGGYLGTIWQGNSSGGLVRPKTAVVASLDPPPYHCVCLVMGMEPARAEARRAEQLLPEVFRPVGVKVVGAGEKNAKIVVVC